MIWEISAIEEGENPEDVIVTVSYWHDNHPGGKARRPNRDPDYVEDHHIIGVPDPQPHPLRNALGQFIGVDGKPVMEWTHNAQGELVRVDPHDIAEEIQWTEVGDDARDKLIMDPLSEQASRVAASRRKGSDRLPEKPQARRGRPDLPSVASRSKGRIVGRLGIL